MSRQGDQVIAAWCQTERVEDDWAGALAHAAQCSKGWVYERRKRLLATRKIDIALPFAFYRDLVFFGPNSLTKPKDRAAFRLEPVQCRASRLYVPAFRSRRGVNQPHDVVPGSAEGLSQIGRAHV